ncbi:MAG: type II toxin-antitoxin system HipA family toxin [Candidatus Nanopelagicaceae bacterium]|nr:type II toxin-antitoxin system HipA family toxin [Candidatus Nanopelagicaceae bacterium]
MSAYVPVDVIEVRCWGRTVGALAYDSRLGLNVFEYTPEWIASGVELSPLHMANRNGTYSFPQLAKETYCGLPSMIADALPDAFGNAVIDAWLSSQGVDKFEIKTLDRLAYAGERALGALTFHPAQPNLAGPATAIQIADVVAGARLVLAGEAAQAGSAHDALTQLIQVGSSAGGARAKAIVAYQPHTHQFRSGYVSAEPRFEPWLMKLDGVSKSADGSINSLDRPEQFTRIEYAYYLMAQAAGITMSESRLYEEGDRAHFLTRRFDRDSEGERIHFQSLCAMDQLDFRYRDTHDYSQYFNVIRKLGMGAEELTQAFRRMVFNVVCMNRDDHTKNVGFLLEQGGTWDLAPAYDVTHAFNPKGEWTQRHQMGVNSKFDQIALADIYQVGSAQAIPAYKSVVAEVMSAAKDWELFATKAGVSLESRRKIAMDMVEHQI